MNETLGLRLYLVPLESISSSTVVATKGRGLQGSSPGPLTIAPSMIPSSRAYLKSWVTIPPSWAFFNISLSALRADTQSLYLPSSVPILFTSLECSVNGFHDPLKFVHDVEVEEAPRTLGETGTALDAHL